MSFLTKALRLKLIHRTAWLGEKILLTYQQRTKEKLSYAELYGENTMKHHVVVSLHLVLNTINIEHAYQLWWKW